ncbi:hypothetical protein QVD17_06309 [Tagetes erecta]|uniref:Uncharacterized protein n=1 Tax=Tagetes erecta TaxID=13708 RepID=A0AAD8LFD9_TARER|nr:hypothetical protein QVD17_06309 [Tagetes erecta]
MMVASNNSHCSYFKLSCTCQKKFKSLNFTFMWIFLFFCTLVHDETNVLLGELPMANAVVHLASPCVKHRPCWRSLQDVAH